MNDPKAFLAAIVLVALLVWFFIQGGWRSAHGALTIALTIMVVLRLVGLWAW